MAEANYLSGDDYVVEFLGYRFGFNATDFEERVTGAAVKLGLVGDNELDEYETADLVELVERDWIDEPRSGLVSSIGWTITQCSGMKMIESRNALSGSFIQARLSKAF